MDLLRALLLTFTVMCCLASPQAGTEPRTRLAIDIAAQPLARALTEFATQTGLQVIFVSALVDTKKSIGAPAGQSLTDALTHLLTGTGLRFEFLNSRTVRILALPSIPATTALPSERHARSRVRIDAGPIIPDEVTVTGTKRVEQQSGPPTSIATWTQESIVASGAKTIADLTALTPGVEFDFYPDLGPGTKTNIAIRGINSRDGTSTGMYLDDTPLRGDAGGSFGRFFPFPFDVERVEILRGPQGTLLGDSAEGGAIRIISNQPSLTTSSGLTQAEVATTERGAWSYEIGAAAGGPLVKDVVAFRASAWYRSVGGYIDRVDPFSATLADRNVNRSIDKSVRGAMTFAPTETLEITPSLTYQSHQAHDAPTFNFSLQNPRAGVLRSTKLLRQPVGDEFYLASLKIVATLRTAEFSSVSSYFGRRASADVGATNNPIDWGSPLGPEYPNSEDDSLPSVWDLEQSTFSQEIRFASGDPEDTVNWVVGGVFLRAWYSDVQTIFLHIASDGREVGNYSIDYDGEETQFAAFGEIGLRLSR